VAQRHGYIVAGIAVAVALAVLWATRVDPVLSPDSITYLSTAANLRAGRGFVDFTGEAMAVFPPLYVLLLAPGGRSLLWARLVGAAALAGCAVGMWALLRHRVDPVLALVAAGVFAFSTVLVRIAGTVWSEVPYIAIALAALVVATRPRPSDRWAALAGALAGLGFLMRYAAVGLVFTVVVAVALSSAALGASLAARRVAVAGGVAALVVAPWIVRNLVVVGEPLGPRFEGGAGEAITVSIERALAAIGQSIIGDSRPDGTARAWGLAVALSIVVFAVVAVVRLAVRPAEERWRRSLVTDVAVGVFGLTSMALPVITRSISANDIEIRVMSPVFVATVYVVFVAVSYVPSNPASATLGVVVVLIWVGATWAAMMDFPDRARLSIIDRDEFSAAMHDEIDALPDDALILSNSPQRVWWHNDRQPVSFAFTRPRPGNSHYPLDADQVLAAACTGEARLAWFPGLLNAGEGPEERRPDLLEVVRLEPVVTVEGGVVYAVSPIDPAACPR
jgi:4-amino-4-deoxy-L-arabinose transferase-like glycosyltransferase